MPGGGRHRHRLERGRRRGEGSSGWAARRWPPSGRLTFVQISDTHMGFKGRGNPDPNATLQVALDKIATLPSKPAMMIHTGDVTHLSNRRNSTPPSS